MAQIVEIASAKINLALHVTGQREDGYHLLDSLVTFAERGDIVTANSSASEDNFSLSGPFSEGLHADGSNLVIKARDLLRAFTIEAGGEAPAVSLHLEKNLPVASGIGGGSADAAATLRALVRLWNAPVSPERLEATALELGADVPMCLHSRPLVARGIGEQLTSASTLPGMNLLLVNPLKPVSTPNVFKALPRKDNAPLAALPPSFSLTEWIEYLGEQRNDLEPPAALLMPDIPRILTLLKLTGAHVCRMSGSGATCFGIFDTREAARTAERNLRSAQPDWFVQAVTTISGDEP